MAKLGTKVDMSKVTKGAPPVILSAQVDGHIVLTTPAEIKQWEEDVKQFYGLTIDVAASGLHAACTTCS